MATSLDTKSYCVWIPIQTIEGARIEGRSWNGVAGGKSHQRLSIESSHTQPLKDNTQWLKHPFESVHARHGQGEDNDDDVVTK